VFNTQLLFFSLVFGAVFPWKNQTKAAPPQKKKTWEILKPPFHPIFQKTGEIPHFSRKNRYR
jgi:hypothetical protein